MALSDKLVDALRASLILNERVTQLGGKVERLDADMRNLDRRLVRIETLVEVSEKRQGRLPPN